MLGWAHPHCQFSGLSFLGIKMPHVGSRFNMEKCSADVPANKQLVRKERNSCPRQQVQTSQERKSQMGPRAVAGVSFEEST